MANRGPFLVDIGPGLSMMIGLPKITSWNTAGRPQEAKTGTIGFNFQTSNLEYFSRSRWLKLRMKKI